MQKTALPLIASKEVMQVKCEVCGKMVEKPLILKKLAHRELIRLGKEFQKDLPEGTTSLELLGRR